MSLEIIRRIDVDFYSNKLIYVNAKQKDISRFILITCYDQGKKIFIDNITNSAYVRCKKPDNNGAFNECMITEDGEIMVELTEQMLAVPGNVLVDILVYDTTEVIVSTMNFCINVIGTAWDNSEIESSSEYKALNALVIEAKAEYDYVIETSKANLDETISHTQNAKVSEEAAKISEEKSLVSEQKAKASELASKASEEAAKNSEEKALVSEQNALKSEQKAKEYKDKALDSEENALVSEQNAKVSELASKTSEEKALISETNAKSSEEAAKLSENNAKTSEINALQSEQNAKASENNASDSEQNALSYSENAKVSENNAKVSEINAKASEEVSIAKAKETEESASLAKTYSEQAKESLDSIDESANLSRSYAVGDTASREGEETDNAKYYYEQTKVLAGNQEAATLNEVQEYLGIV